MRKQTKEFDNGMRGLAFLSDEEPHGFVWGLVLELPGEDLEGTVHFVRREVPEADDPFWMDAELRKALFFARELGYAKVMVSSVFPSVNGTWTEEEDRDEYIRAFDRQADETILCYGDANCVKGDEVRAMLDRPKALSVTRDGNPSPLAMLGADMTQAFELDQS
jgi:hypothetical protein